MILQWLSNNWICVLLALGCGYIGGVGYRYWVETTRVAKDAFESEMKRKELEDLFRKGWAKTLDNSNEAVKKMGERENER